MRYKKFEHPITDGKIYISESELNEITDTLDYYFKDRNKWIWLLSNKVERSPSLVFQILNGKRNDIKGVIHEMTILYKKAKKDIKLKFLK